jgi:hypothetical protein
VDRPKPGEYDAMLQQWREAGGLNVERLCFLRWLAVRGRLERATAGPPADKFMTDAVLDVYYAASLPREAPCSRP